VLEGHDGLESANANLMGQVSLAWDDERTSREALLAAMAGGGFRPMSPDEGYEAVQRRLPTGFPVRGMSVDNRSFMRRTPC